MTVLLAKRGFISPGSRFLRDMERLGATDAWDFVGQSYLRAGVVGPSGITFTRASSGYAETSDGRLVEFASGVPRVTDFGLLIEPAATNLIPYSQQFDTNWTSQELTITSNATAAPDGTTTATSIVPTAVTSTHQLAGGTLVSSQACVISVYAKANGYNTFEMLERATASNGARFNLTNGAVTNLGTGIGTATALANGWYRCSVAVTATGVRFYIPNSASNFTGDGTSGIFLWGAQFETGSILSSLVKTSGGSATRAADVVTVTSLTYSGAHSLVAFKGASTAAGNETILQLDDGTTDNRSLVYRNTTGNILIDSGGGNQANQAIGTWAATAQRYVARIATNDVRGALNGTLGTADTSATLPAGTLSTLRLGQNVGGNALNGFLSHAALIPRALTNAELEGITA